MAEVANTQLKKHEKLNGRATDPTSLPSAVTAGQNVDGVMSQEGETLVYKSRKDAGEDLANDVQKVEQQFSYANITTATTTTVKSAAGFLHSITVNATAAGTITVYDNTAGSGATIATLAASVGENTFTYDVGFSTGLTIVTAAASNITVSYR